MAETGGPKKKNAKFDIPLFLYLIALIATVLFIGAIVIFPNMTHPGVVENGPLDYISSEKFLENAGIYSSSGDGYYEYVLRDQKTGKSIDAFSETDSYAVGDEVKYKITKEKDYATFGEIKKLVQISNSR